MVSKKYKYFNYKNYIIVLGLNRIKNWGTIIVDSAQIYKGGFPLQKDFLRTGREWNKQVSNHT